MKFTRKSLLITLTVALSIITVPPALEASLKVYKINGDITLKSGNRWKPLQRRAEIASSDMLRIPAGATIEILDSDTRRLYSSLTSGDMSVNTIINEAINDADRVTLKANQRILTSINESGRKREPQFNGSGISIHDTDASTALTAFDPSKPYLRQLMQLPADAHYNDSTDIILIRRDITDSDNTFNFAVFNTLDQYLYINIIDQNDNGEINFYFNENPIAKPTGETVIGEYRYLLPEEHSGYIVIGSDMPFTADDIRTILNGGTPKAEGNFFYSLLRI